MFILPPGAFIALGFILAGVNMVNIRLKRRKEAKLEEAVAVSS
jgi:electron transport complex protein RnfE